jgi:hypothetical protein
LFTVWFRLAEASRRLGGDDDCWATGELTMLLTKPNHPPPLALESLCCCEDEEEEEEVDFLGFPLRFLLFFREDEEDEDEEEVTAAAAGGGRTAAGDPSLDLNFLLAWPEVALALAPPAPLPVQDWWDEVEEEEEEEEEEEAGAVASACAARARADPLAWGALAEASADLPDFLRDLPPLLLLTTYPSKSVMLGWLREPAACFLRLERGFEVRVEDLPSPCFLCLLDERTKKLLIVLDRLSMTVLVVI